MTFRPMIALPLAALAVGCAQPKTQFAVSLRNAGERPVTAWLTKTGDRGDPNWLAPEDLSTSRAAAVGQVNGVVIPPGRTGEVGPIAGTFEADALAILRVYAGQLSFDEMLATGPDSSLRVDVPLREGMNRLEVRPGAKLAVEHAGE